MFTASSKRMTIFGGLAFIALVGLMTVVNEINAEEEQAKGIVVGTYEPGQIAEQANLQQKMMDAMNGLQERAMEIQKAGDQEAMMALQTEAQQIQEKIIGEFEAELNKVMPAVAEQAGVQIIALEVSYSVPGVEVKDVTVQLLAEMAKNAPAVDAPSPGLNLVQ